MWWPCTQIPGCWALMFNWETYIVISEMIIDSQAENVADLDSLGVLHPFKTPEILKK